MKIVRAANEPLALFSQVCVCVLRPPEFTTIQACNYTHSLLDRVYKFAIKLTCSLCKVGKAIEGKKSGGGGGGGEWKIQSTCGVTGWFFQKTLIIPQEAFFLFSSFLPFFIPLGETWYLKVFF